MRSWTGRIALTLFIAILCTPALAQSDSILRANSAFTDGNYKIAAAEYMLVLKEDPGNKAALLKLAQCHCALKEWDNAVHTYEDLIALGPVTDATREQYADALRQNGQLESALEQYRILESAAERQALLDKAGAAYDKRNFKLAAELYKEITVSYPAESDAWTRLVEIHTGSGDTRALLMAFRGLEATGSMPASMRESYGDALKDSGDLEGAIRQYSLAVESGQAGSPATTPAPAANEATVTGALSDEATLVTLNPTGSTTISVKPKVEPAPLLVDTVSADEHPEPVATEVEPAPRKLPARDTAPATPGTSGQFYVERRISAMESDDQPGNGNTEVSAATDWLSVARTHAALKEWDEAVEAFQNLMDEGPIDIDVRLEYALALREAGDLTRARDEYNRALFANPNNLDAKLGLAMVLAYEGKLEEVNILLDQVYLDDLSYQKALFTRAYAYYVNGYIEDAWRDIGEALARNPRNAEAAALLTGDEFTSETWDRVYQLLKANPENDYALEILDQIISEERASLSGIPEGPGGHAEWMFQTGQYKEAILEYEELLRNNPGDPQSLQRLGTLYRWEELYEEALEAYIEYLRYMPGDMETRLRYCETLLWAGYAQEALDELWYVINDVDTPLEIYEEALGIYALALSALGRNEEAQEWYEEALVFTRHNVEIRTAYAGNLAMMGRYKQAIAEYEKVLADDPTYEPAILGIAQAYSWGGDQKKALEYFSRISTGDVYYEAGQVGTAYAYLWSGDRAQARSLASQLERLYPNNPEVMTLKKYIAEGEHPVLSFTRRNTRDNESNNSCTLMTSMYVPINDRGAAVMVKHEDISLGTRYPVIPGVGFGYDSESTDGTATSITLTVPANERTTISSAISFVEMDNKIAQYGSNEEQMPGRRLTTRHTDKAVAINYRVNDNLAVRAAYNDYMLREITRLAQTGVTSQDITLGATLEIDDRVFVSGDYTQGDYSDTNKRRSAGVSVWREHEVRNKKVLGTEMSGTVNTGLRLRQTGFTKDLNNGYWDPECYNLGEIYVDWADNSKHRLKVDGGAGVGYQNANGGKAQDVFHWNAGLRYLVPWAPIEFRAGYFHTDAANVATSATGYEFEEWYFTGGYVF